MNYTLSIQDVVIHIDGRSADLQLAVCDGIKKVVNNSSKKLGNLVIVLQSAGLFFDRKKFVEIFRGKHVLDSYGIGKSSFGKVLLAEQEDKTLDDADVIADTQMLNEIREQTKIRETLLNAPKTKLHS